MNASQLIYTALTDLVDGRVYPLFIPEQADDTPPYIVYQVVSSVPYNTIDGITHHERVRVQIDIYHHNYDDLLDLYASVLDALDDLPAAEHDSSRFGADGVLFVCQIDYLINHTSKPP